MSRKALDTDAPSQQTRAQAPPSHAAPFDELLLAWLSIQVDGTAERSTASQETLMRSLPGVSLLCRVGMARRSGRVPGYLRPSRHDAYACRRLRGPTKPGEAERTCQLARPPIGLLRPVSVLLRRWGCLAC